MPKDQVIKKAKKLLEANHRTINIKSNGSDKLLHYTCASPRYKHQWLWDSGFIATSLANYDIRNAKREITSLLHNQRDDGFLSIINFWQGKSFFEKLFYLYFGDGKITKITQPPILSLAIEKIYQKDKDKEFLLEVLDKSIAFLDHLRTVRDPDKSGLVSIISPWEWGIDFSPAIDPLLGITSDKPNVLETFLPNFKILRKYKKLKWDEDKIMSSRIFNVKGVMFNVIYIEALRASSRMLKELGEMKRSQEYSKYSQLAESALLKNCWDDERGLFFDISNSRGNEGLLKVATVSSLTPLMLDNLPKDIVRRLVTEHLNNKDEFATKYPVPSVSINEKTFNPNSNIVLWRGTTWINSNWMLIKGLIKHGYHKEAKELGNQTIELVGKSDFWEYYNPLTGKGGGMKDLSWSALVIDIAAIICDIKLT